jgi:transposase-like protein
MKKSGSRRSLAPALRRRIIKFRKKDGLSFREIARRTGVCRETAARVCRLADRSVDVDEMVKESGLHPEWLASIQDMLRATGCPSCEFDFVILASMAEARCPRCRHTFRLSV